LMMSQRREDRLPIYCTMRAHDCVDPADCALHMKCRDEIIFSPAREAYIGPLEVARVALLMMDVD